MVHLLGDKLIDENQHYRYLINRHNESKTRTYWRCARRRECGGTCVTTYYKSPGLQIISYGNLHQHASEEVEIHVEEVIADIKQQAESNPDEPPTEILQRKLENLQDKQVLAKLPSRSSLLKTIHRYQKRQRLSTPYTSQLFEEQGRIEIAGTSSDT